MMSSDGFERLTIRLVHLYVYAHYFQFVYTMLYNIMLKLHSGSDLFIIHLSNGGCRHHCHRCISICRVNLTISRQVP